MHCLKKPLGIVLKSVNIRIAYGEIAYYALFGVDIIRQLPFAKCKAFLRQDPVHATSRAHLWDLLAGRKTNGIIFTTMRILSVAISSNFLEAR